MGRSNCTHSRAKFYAVQTFKGMKSIRLYNCPDCHSTISEQTLREARQRELVGAAG